MCRVFYSQGKGGDMEKIIVSPSKKESKYEEIRHQISQTQLESQLLFFYFFKIKTYWKKYSRRKYKRGLEKLKIIQETKGHT